MDQRLAVKGTSSTTYYYIKGYKNKYTLTFQYPVLHDAAILLVAPPNVVNAVHVTVAALATGEHK